MSHLTIAQRYTIESMLKLGCTQVEIGIAIEKDKSVISKEISRNSDHRNGKYNSDLAQRKYDSLQHSKRKFLRFTSEIEEETEKLLRKDLSPEQVVGFLKDENKPFVSIERIYQHIWRDKKKGGTLYQHLRTGGKKYQKRGSKKDTRGIIKNRVDIEKRPKTVEQRSRFGDLEVDLIIGKHHKQAILTINDRASGMLKMTKVESKEASVVSKAIVNELEDWKPYIYTITSDNGKEFSNHEFVAEQLTIHHYFAKPYHSWQRGSNENLNGLIRQYFKKSSDFTKISKQQIKDVELKLNSRPRKRFKYKNPISVMDNLLFNQKVAFVT